MRNTKRYWQQILICMIFTDSFILVIKKTLFRFQVYNFDFPHDLWKNRSFPRLYSKETHVEISGWSLDVEISRFKKSIIWV